MQLELESLKVLYSDKMEEVKSGHAINYDKDKLSQTYKFNSEVENSVVELALLSDRITKLQDKLDVIVKALERLDEKERKVLRLRYMERNRWGQRNSWKEISWQMKYDRSWCFAIHDKAIQDMAVCMFREMTGN